MSSSVYQTGRVFYRLLLILATKYNTTLSISISVMSLSTSSMCIASSFCLCFTFKSCLTCLHLLEHFEGFAAVVVVVVVVIDRERNGSNRMECKKKAPARSLPIDYRFLFPFPFLFGSWWSLLYVTSFVTSRRNGWTDRVSYCYLETLLYSYCG
jgi:hypothetical protein